MGNIWNWDVEKEARGHEPLIRIKSIKVRKGYFKIISEKNVLQYKHGGQWWDVPTTNESINITENEGFTLNNV